MRRLALFPVLLLLIRASLLTQQAPTAAIEGVVVDANTDQSVSGAQVSLTSLPNALLPNGQVNVVNPTPIAQPVQIPIVTTGTDGKFSFKQLGAGNYRAFVTATGYTRQEYGQRAINGQGRPIYLAAGETFKDATFRLIPSGTLSGRVTDENGQPAIGAPVQLLRPVYNIQGKNYQSVGGANADDRGQYRVFGLPPGRYIIAAGNPPGPNRILAAGGGAIVGGGIASGSARYELLYYPNAEDIEQAAPIEIKSGSELTMDLRVTRQSQTFSVRGRVIDATTGAPPQNIQVMLGYRYLNGSGSFSQGQAYNAATGNFELRSVAPGEYTLQAQVNTSLPGIALAGGQIDAAVLDAQRAAQAARPTAQVPIRVINADVEGLVLTVKPGVTLGGRVQLEGQQVSSIPNLDRLRVNLSSLAAVINGAPVSTPTQPDGTFQIQGLREAEYRVNVVLPGSNFYVKSVSYGGDDIYTKPFRFAGAGSGTVDIVLRSGIAQVSGVVTNAQSQPVPGLQVVAIRSPREQRPDAIRVATTDQVGRFNIQSLPPGDYRIYSWESIDNNAFYDPEFLKPYEQRGVLVHLAESGSPTIHVEMIPAQ